MGNILFKKCIFISGFYTYRTLHFTQKMSNDYIKNTLTLLYELQFGFFQTFGDPTIYNV